MAERLSPTLCVIEKVSLTGTMTVYASQAEASLGGPGMKQEWHPNQQYGATYEGHYSPNSVQPDGSMPMQQHQQQPYAGHPGQGQQYNQYQQGQYQQQGYQQQGPQQTRHAQGRHRLPVKCAHQAVTDEDAQVVDHLIQGAVQRPGGVGGGPAPFETGQLAQEIALLGVQPVETPAQQGGNGGGPVGRGRHGQAE